MSTVPESAYATSPPARKVDPEASFDGFELTGLNQTTVEELAPVEKRYRYESFARIERVPIQLDPCADTHLRATTRPADHAALLLALSSDISLRFPTDSSNRRAARLENGLVLRWLAEASVSQGVL